MTLNEYHAVYCAKLASFGAHQENLNEIDRPTVSGRNVTHGRFLAFSETQTVA